MTNGEAKEFIAQSVKSDVDMALVADAIKALEQEPQSFKWCTDCKEYDQEKHCCHRWSKVIRDTVEEMKQEPKTRHWIPLGYEDEWWGEVCTCSECGSSMFRSNYCPNCGAKMIEPQERENE